MTARAIIGVNVRLEVQSTEAAAVTVTAIAVDTSGVATVSATGHGLSNGNIVRLDMTEGMDQLDGQACRVTNVSGADFDLEGIDASSYAVFVSGTVTKITAFSTFSKAQTVTAPNPAPAKIDLTTLIDLTKQYAYGLPDAPDGTVGALFNPGGTTEALIQAATNANSPLVFRITYADGRKTIFNANVSGGYGFDLQQNQAAKSTVAFTPVKLMMHYSS